MRACRCYWVANLWCCVCSKFLLHSFLIVHYAKADGVSLDVGFYYMANAMGRLIGTVLSGWVFQAFGMGSSGCRRCGYPACF